ncbi:MAG: D-alanine--poly(phosphoribitol) ligase subunit 1 [Thermoproteota archaeon]|jgi:D-alanine--poly(phosphoribitol) ligase subunit 1
MIRGFLNSVEKFPNYPAITIDNNWQTYNELFDLSAQIAKEIEGIDSPLIGIYTDNNLHTYAGILAILMCGKGFVPLNHKFPDHRLKSILTQLNLTEVIGCKSSENRITNLNSGTAYFPIDSLSNSQKTLNNTFPRKTNSAYVLFTSGSTGIPKGIPISFENFDGLLDGINERWKVNSSDIVLQAFELSFDVSLANIFLTFQAGAHLVVTSFDGITAINSYKSILDHKVTFAILPPSSISYLKKFKLLKDVKIPSVHTTVFTGEALFYENVREWKIGAPNSKIRNAYGPTEGTVWSLEHLLDENEINEVSGSCPIGTPLKHIAMEVDSSSSSSIDQGELCISGVQIFDGYINNSERTAKVLVRKKNGTVFYKTGDLVKKDENGIIHYINRLDNQVQINGFRVELGEIEFAIKKLTNNSETVVFASEFLESLSLIAVIEKEKEDIAKLKSNLSKLIPSYMMPRKIHFIDTLPLNSSGKIDRVTLKKKYSDAT